MLRSAVRLPSAVLAAALLLGVVGAAAQTPVKPAQAADVAAATAASADLAAVRGRSVLLDTNDRVLAHRAAAQAGELAAARASAVAEQKRQLAAAAAAVRARAAAEQARVTREAARNPKALGQLMAGRRGWTGRQWQCLNLLWAKESGWKVHANNPSSSAYGIPQALPGSKMAGAGHDWRNNPATQITWGLGYIGSHYGSPCGAWAHSRSHNWY